MLKFRRMMALLLFLLLLLQLAACALDDPTEPSSNEQMQEATFWDDPTPWPPPVTHPPEPTGSSAPPPETETEPPKELTREEMETAAGVYELAPDDLMLFIFNGHQPMPYHHLDISGLEVGYLYVCNTKTDEISATGLCGIGGFNVTKEHIYYTLAGDHTKILRTDYTFQEQTVVFETTRKITDFDFYGMDANGDLAIVLDAQQVILYHMDTGETDLIMEQYYVASVLYFGSSIGHRAAPDVGPTLHWRGQPTAEPDKGIDFYAYFIELDEMKAFDLPDD